MSKTPDKVIDFNWVSQKWSPENARIERSNGDRYKVRSIQGGHVVLRGGDYITNRLGQGVTVSFCFFNNGKKYGLTVAHIFQRVGDVVCAHSTDTPNPTTGKYVIAEIGKVVALHWNTDSAVFEIRGWVEIEALRLASQSGLAGPLTLTGWDAVPPLQIGARLVGFGAQRRGAVAVVSQFWNNSTGGQQLPVLDGDIFLASNEGRPPTDDGDCGTIFIDENSIPRYFHHCIVGSFDTPPPSYRDAGVPFDYILKAHPIILGGDVPVAGPLAASHQSALLQPPNVTIKDASLLAEKQGSSGDSRLSVPTIKKFAATQPSKLFDVEIVAPILESSNFSQIVAGAAQFDVEFVDLDPAHRAST